jgi:uncharacterized protein YqeY
MTTILERVQADTRVAMKAGDRDRVGALRMIASALQQEAKEGKGDAFREGGGDERAAAEEAEAQMIGDYLPAELSDEELADLVDAAVAEAGASEAGDIGRVMGIVMPRVGGRADGKRVSTTVRERLG